MPRPRKCIEVPEMLRRLEYLESLNPATELEQKLISKYNEIESQQQFKIDYLLDKEEEINKIESRVEVEYQMEDDEDAQNLIKEQELMIEHLQKQQELNLKVFQEVYKSAQISLNLNDIDFSNNNTAIFDGLKEIYQGIVGYKKSL
ncbi:hypothetical protein SS50377_22340 [Spironucleus salmonicida]|uniref:Uncharacterized protein n=1 Tax=Spironucleus salmonicida TaxID=348837 RepID=V6LCG8_9EUKA|nr:hypothetical protein SS50377_22340 [Spironucleus salmonicida]|eukprot:EST42165.1 Hypothetical protein SS50377_18473 [Spironucleus salmonicida]